MCASALETSTVVPRTMKTPSGTNKYPFPKSSHAAPAPGAQADGVAAQCQGELAKGFEFTQGCSDRGGALVASERGGATYRFILRMGDDAPLDTSHISRPQLLARALKTALPGSVNLRSTYFFVGLAGTIRLTADLTAMNFSGRACQKPAYTRGIGPPLRNLLRDGATSLQEVT